METPILDALVKEFSALKQENERLKFCYDQMQKQLIVIGMNFGGKMGGLEYNDLSIFDWDKIVVTIGMSGFAIVNKDLQLITDYSELPLLPKK